MSCPDKCPKCGAELVPDYDNAYQCGSSFILPGGNCKPGIEERGHCFKRQRDALEAALLAEEKTKDPIRWAHPDTTRRVAYLNALRSVVSRKCPKNKGGVPLVSDFDLLAASKEEIAEAFEIAKGKTP